jgi:MFS family permease
MQQKIQSNKLFVASCLALMVTGMTFGIRAGNLPQWAVEFNLNATELSAITATAFWGFPLAVILGGMIVDAIGMKKLLVMAFIFHLAGIVLTVYAGSFGNAFWPLFMSTLLIGIANGTVEAACNPLVAALYPGNKTTKLNHFHLWFPGGIVIGSLIVHFYGTYVGGNLGSYKPWQIEVATMIIPILIYGILFAELKFPPTERVAAGITTAEMYKALATPLFIFMILCMFGTAITELYTQQWIPVLLKNVTNEPILILTLTTGVMVIGRAFAGPVVHKLAPQGVLLMSAILAATGIYMLGHTTGNMLYFAAIIFGLGVCYFWPTMLGFVSENVPKTGAVGINLMGGVGMFSVSIYMMLMGGYYDKIVSAKLPAGANLKDYAGAAPGTSEATALADAQAAAGPEILNTTLIIPIILVVAFSGLVIYMRGRRRLQVLTPATNV